jgi:hypothetical protein
MAARTIFQEGDGHCVWVGDPRTRQIDALREIAERMRATRRPVLINNLVAAKVPAFRAYMDTVAAQAFAVEYPMYRGDKWKMEVRTSCRGADLITFSRTYDQLKSMKVAFETGCLQHIATAISKTAAKDATQTQATRALASAQLATSENVSRLMVDQESMRRQFDELKQTTVELANRTESIRAAMHAAHARLSGAVSEEELQRCVERIIPDLRGMAQTAAERAVENILTASRGATLPLPASAAGTVTCYVCLETVDSADSACFCREKSHALHRSCCMGMIAAAGEMVDEDGHRLPTQARCGVCRGGQQPDALHPRFPINPHESSNDEPVAPPVAPPRRSPVSHGQDPDSSSPRDSSLPREAGLAEGDAAESQPDAVESSLPREAGLAEGDAAESQPDAVAEDRPAPEGALLSPQLVDLLQVTLPSHPVESFQHAAFLLQRVMGASEFAGLGPQDQLSRVEGYLTDTRYKRKIDQVNRSLDR